MYRTKKMLGVLAICAAALLAPTIAATQEKPDAGAKAIATRQGHMKLVIWDAGPLFGMAKGKVDYDAGAAAAHAANLIALSQYSLPQLFVPGTSNADRPGKTCTLPAASEDTAKLEQAYKDFQVALAALGDAAGSGQPALAAAVGEMGKTCGGCHKPFRAKHASGEGYCSGG
jgi:cytochrome c556